MAIDRGTMVRAFVVAALAAVCLAASSFSAIALEPRRAGQDAFISRAVFANGQLWLLSDAGILFTINEHKAERSEVKLPEPALDLWLQDGQPSIATCEAICAHWSIRHLVDGEWKTDFILEKDGDDFIGIGHMPGVTAILTSTRVVEISNGTRTETRLSEMLRSAGVTTVYTASEDLLVGFNAGEWGGGLKRIGRKTGKVSVVERNVSGELCDGPLNTACDPVNGIATIPWKPDCLAVAIGLVHFAPHGRIAEICGDKVESIYSKSLADRAKNENEIAFSGDEAFFGLTRRGDALWAVGTGGLYRFTSATAVQSFSLPKFKSYDGVWVSFAQPELVLVLTSINQRRSISGAAPMLVPR
jgi:hypothetical protein